MTCLVSGTVKRPDGAALIATTIIFVRTGKVVGFDAQTVAPERITVVTDALGQFSVPLFPGDYNGRIVSALMDGNAETFFAVVPDAPTANLRDIIDQAPSSPVVITAIEARDQAQAAASSATASATAAASSQSLADVARTQAQLASVAAGATLYASVADGEADTVNGDVFLVSTEPGVQVYENSAGTGSFLGWLGEVLLDDVTALMAWVPAPADGTIIRTRREGWAYEADSGLSASELVGSSVKLRVLPGPNGQTPLEAFGVVLDGATDNAATLAATAAARASFTGTFSAGPGVCKLDGTFALPRHASLRCRGTVFDASGGTGTYDTAVIYKKGATPTAIADLASSPAKGAMTLTFAAAHGLSVGDTILIYNPTDGSFSNFRPSYREGEFCKVAAVTSGSEVELDGPLMASHSHTASEVYKCADMATGTLEGFTVKAPGAGVNGGILALRVDMAEGMMIDSVRAEGSDNASMTLKHCYRTTGRSIYAHQWGRVNLALGTYYGLSIANSQELDLTGIFIGERHGITTGGFDDFSIPCRAVRVHDFDARNSDPEIAAADWHGNTEYSTYCDGICYGGGLNIAGDFNSIENVEVVGGPGCIGVLGREISGLTHSISNVRIFTDRNDTTRGVGVDIGGNSNPMTADTKRGGCLKINNINVVATSQERQIIRVRNRGFTGGEWSISIDGIFVNNPTGLDGLGGVVQIATVSGDPPARMSFEGWHLAATANKSPLSLDSLDANVLVRMSPISGSVDYTTSTGASFVDSLLTMPITFPKVPHVSAVLVGSPTTSGDRIGVSVTLLTASQIRPRISRMDDPTANFTAAVTRTVTWQAMLAEF